MENNNKGMTPVEIISEITENWFLMEPMLFAIYCTHKLVSNEGLNIPFRSGKKRIEYNPDILKNLPSTEIAERLKIEVLRIILKHPYRRMPVVPIRAALGIASDITIADNYKTQIDISTHKDFNLPANLSYEEYYSALIKKLPKQEDIIKALEEDADKDCDEDENSQSFDKSEDNDEDNSEENKDDSDNPISNLASLMGLGKTSYELSELWEEDQEVSEKINAEIERTAANNGWGSIPGSMIQMIEASLVIKMDYRKMLNHFRSSIISSKRKLTRSKPNRRYNFDYMGSRYDFCTKLLIAVDVSGSISDADLQNFFSIINRFFKYGIELIDVIQFDTEIKEEPLTLKKAKKLVKIKG